jgi:hypothetical protein
MERRRLKVRYLGGVFFCLTKLKQACNVFGYDVGSSAVDDFVKRLNV